MLKPPKPIGRLARLADGRTGCSAADKQAELPIAGCNRAEITWCFAMLSSSWRRRLRSPRAEINSSSRCATTTTSRCPLRWLPSRTPHMRPSPASSQRASQSQIGQIGVAIFVRSSSTLASLSGLDGDGDYAEDDLCRSMQYADCAQVSPIELERLENPLYRCVLN